MKNENLTIIILVMCVITFAIRALPFCFAEYFKDRDIVKYLGYALPAGVMLALTVFSLKNVQLTLYPYGLSSLIPVLVTALVHIYKRNVFLSIFSGTFLYAVLTHFIG